MKEKVEALSALALKIGEEIYGQKGSAEGQAQGDTEGAKKDENTYDAEFKEKKDGTSDK